MSIYRGNRGWPTALFAFALAALVGCTPTDGDASTSSAAPPSANVTATAVVESRTVTDVLTLNVTTVAGANFDVSADAPGALHEQDGVFTFVARDGALRTISLPPTVTSVEPLVALDVTVGEGTPLLSAHDAGLTLKALLTPAQVLRLANRKPTAVRAQIDGSSGPFDCPLADPRPTQLDGDYAVFCRIPPEVPSVVGATGLLALTLDQKVNVPALPIEAVAGSRANGLVYVSGASEARSVQLGISDGAYIEIIKGLNVGDVVLIPSPSLLGSHG
jgi:hypothetical protein